MKRQQNNTSAVWNSRWNSKTSDMLSFNKETSNRSMTKSHAFELDESAMLQVSSVGGTVPVLVSEALTSTGQPSLSVRFFKNNWVCMVAGRRLFVWKYGVGSAGKSSACRELPLPMADLKHRAELVHLILPSGDQQRESTGPVGCLVASPEGVLRHWPRIHQEDVYCETTIGQLRGEECAQLDVVFDGVFLLATRTCSLLLIDTTNSQEGLAYRVLGKSRGLLSGFGRRMSSFFAFGAAGPGGKLDRVHTRVHPTASQSCQVVMLSEDQLHTWSIAHTLDEKHEASINLGRSLRELVARQLWNTESYRMVEMCVVPLDFEVRGDRLYLLATVAADAEESTPRQHVVAIYNLTEDNFDSCVAFNVDPVAASRGQDDSLMSDEAGSCYRLVLPSGERELYPCLIAAVYSHSNIYVIEVLSGTQLARLDLSRGAGSGGVLGVGCSHTDSFLVFSRSHEILAIGHRVRNAAPHEDTHLRSMTSGLDYRPGRRALDSSLRDRDRSPLESSALGTSLTTQTSAMATANPCPAWPRASEDMDALLLTMARVYWMGYKEQARRSAEALLHSYEGSGVRGCLDSCVMRFGLVLLGERPLHDPRWTRALGISHTDEVQFCGTSLIPAQQLTDKLSAQHRLRELLDTTGLSAALTSLPAPPVWSPGEGSGQKGEVVWFTEACLSQLGEMVEAMRALHTMYIREPCIFLEPVLKSVVESRGYELAVFDTLRPADLFFQDISLLPSFLNTLESHWSSAQDDWMAEEDLSANQTRSLDDMLGAARYFGKLIMNCLREASRYRELRIKFLSEKKSAADVYLPCWITSEWPAGVLTPLITMHGHLVVFGERGDNVCAGLAVDLSRLVLDCFYTRVQWAERHCPARGTTSKLKEDFAKARHALIAPISSRLQRPEPALQLAERFVDFELLVRLCEETGSTDRLQHYLGQFAKEGLPEFAMQWFLRAGKRGRLHQLLGSRGLGEGALARLLDAQDTRDISWLHAIHTKNFNKAAETLHELGNGEREYCGRKKTLLSLSKLALLAADNAPNTRALEDINAQLEMIRNQEELPEEVIEHNLGLSHGPKQPVLTPAQVGRLYVSSWDEGTKRRPSLLDFKRAIDLLVGVEDDQEKETLRLHIWCQAIKMDSWKTLSFGDSLDACRGSFFCHLVELTLNEGYDLRDCLPDLDDLLSSEELGPLKEDSQFQYLLRAGYEEMERLYYTNEDSHTGMASATSVLG